MLGVVVLNRPKALNALNMNMIHTALPMIRVRLPLLQSQPNLMFETVGVVMVFLVKLWVVPLSCLKRRVLCVLFLSSAGKKMSLLVSY